MRARNAVAVWGSRVTRPDLKELVNAAAAARPTLDRAAFADHLAVVAPETGELAVADLALAFQAAHGDQVAVSELHAIVERASRLALRVAGYSATVADDAIQETSVRLLVAQAGKNKPILLTYQGRARLSAWIKTIALRTASRLMAIENRVDRDEGVLERLADSHDPITHAIKADIRPAARAAFVAAVRGLSYFHRELLGAVILDGATIDDLSRQHGVHRATAARWVGRARAALDDGVRRELASALDLSPSEVSSVLTAIATSIELTPARLLAGMPTDRK